MKQIYDGIYFFYKEASIWYFKGRSDHKMLPKLFVLSRLVHQTLQKSSRVGLYLKRYMLFETSGRDSRTSKYSILVLGIQIL